MNIGSLMTKMAILVIFMIIGYASARSKKVGPDFARSASWLTINVFLTATIINSSVSNLPEMDGGQLANMMLVLFATIVIIYAFSELAARLMHQDRDHEGLSMALMGVVNSMFFALPVVQELYGAEGVLYVSLSCLPFNLMLYTYAAWRMKASAEKFHLTARDVFSMPLNATLVALALFVFRIPVPETAKEVLNSISSATMPMSMLVVGTSLGSISLSDAFKGWQTYYIAFIRLIVTPVLVWFLLRLMSDNTVLISACTIVAASPTGMVVTALSIQFGKDAVYCSRNILANSILSVATIPLMVLLLGL